MSFYREQTQCKSPAKNQRLVASIPSATVVSSFSFALNDLYVGRSNASARLIEEFTVSEALHAVRSMNRCSAPGPDGFGPSFYVAAWDAIKDDVMLFL
jgi:hypothetical protein